MEKIKEKILQLQEVNGDLTEFAKLLKTEEPPTYGELFSALTEMIEYINAIDSNILHSLFDNLSFMDHMSKYIPGEDKPSYKYDELLKAMTKTVNEFKLPKEEKLAKVDKDLCIGCGACEAVLPEAFRLNEEGKAECYAPHEKIEAAVVACPVSAISVEG